MLAWLVKPSGCTDGALDKQSFHRGSTNIAERRPPSGALPLSPTLRGPPPRGRQHAAEVDVLALDGVAAAYGQFS